MRVNVFGKYWNHLKHESYLCGRVDLQVRLRVQFKLNFAKGVKYRSPYLKTGLIKAVVNSYFTYKPNKFKPNENKEVKANSNLATSKYLLIFISMLENIKNFFAQIRDFLRN